MGVVKVILIVALISSAALAAEDTEKRPVRTLARFLGLEPRQQQPVQQQQVQQQPQQQVVPLVYNVKYYDRAGENPEVQVEQAQFPQAVVQQQQQQQQQVVPFQDRVVPSTRVFLNLYTGQQTPVYYDSKGQLYVPCPAYDHQHQVHSGGGVKPVGVKSGVGQQATVYNTPEYVYYSGIPQQIQQQVQVPQQQQQQQQQKQVHQQQRPVIGVGHPPIAPYVAPVPVAVPEVLYYASNPQQQQQQQKVVGYPPSSTVVTYNPYEIPYAYTVPSPYGYPGPLVYQNGQGGYVNPFVVMKPAQVTAAPGQGQVIPPHVHVHAHNPQQQQSQQQTDQVVVEKKNVSEKSEGQQN